MSMDKTTLYLPHDMKRELEAVARRSGRAQAVIVREALAQYLGQQPRPWPKSIGAGSDPELSGADSEDWLRENWGKHLDAELGRR
jgi:Ribbon-helix-helix protein, copG family